MILQGAIGDAYGAGFEFADRIKIQECNHLTQYERHPIFPEINGKYTDDTQMTIALAELMLKDEEWTALNIANHFVATFKRDPRRGYAKRFHAFLTEMNSGQEFIDKIINKSERNGAAMRAYILGVLSDENSIIEKSTIQAEVTHATESAIKSANAIALTNHFFIYNKGNRDNLIEYLNDIQKTSWTGIWDGKVGMSGIETVEATLSVLVSSLTMKERLKQSVDYGGDVDTVASLVMAISSQDQTVVQDLPEFLFQDLENDTFGRDYIMDIDEAIRKKYLTNEEE